MVIVQLANCAVMPIADCQVGRTYEPRLEGSSEQYDKYLFQIMFENCSYRDHDQQALFADKIIEEFRASNNYKRFIVTDVFVTKIGNGQFYRALFMK
jgi:hypothetical protein